MKSRDYWVEKLNLAPHPEGGFYIEEYRATESIDKHALPVRFSGPRSFSTGIYFLLPNDTFSAFHCIRQDELWHFYYGSPLAIHIISPDGSYHKKLLGTDIESGQRPLVVVNAGDYFAAESLTKESYTLAGCTVAPGFDFADFEMPDAALLLSLFPQHASRIQQFTRSQG